MQANHIVPYESCCSFACNKISQYQKYHNNLPLCFQNFAEALFLFSLGTYNGPKRYWKQCLCKILEGQTKSIMVFLILANSIREFLRI